MGQIRFETLKKRIIKEINMSTLTDEYEGEFLLLNKRLLAIGEYPIKFYPKTNELVERVKTSINQWDIRQVNKLAEIFPNVVPSWVANCNIDYTENGFVLTKKKYC